MYQMKMDFINLMYGLNLNVPHFEDYKVTPSSVQDLPCNNEDFEAPASSTSTVLGTGSVGSALLGSTVVMEKIQAPPTGNTANYGVVSFTSPGTYTVKHSLKSAGCVTSTNSLVLVNSTPTIAAAIESAPACAGQSAT